jgi:Rrf2 family protein
MELALRYGDGPVQSDIIADAQTIPERFLEKILTSLRGAGMIRSLRGSRGGHALIRDPRDLPLTEVILALDGSLAPISCMEACTCRLYPNCPLRPVWQEVEEVTFRILDGITLADLAKRERERAGLRERYAI